MRWDDFRRSDDIEDRRGEGGYSGGGGFGLPIGGGGIGIGAIVVIALIGWATGVDPIYLIDVITNGGGGASSSYSDTPGRTGRPSDTEGDFVAAIKGEIDDRWREIFNGMNQSFHPARVVLFEGSTKAGACGGASSAMGPFYCPPNQEIFVDLSFFKEIETRFHGCSGRACRFTEAYVIAHEAGHHVQNLLGTLPRVQRQQQAANGRAEANALQVKVELQADCYSGVWANRENKVRNFLDPGDVDAALQTAAAIGDDVLQKRAQGRVVPESFTHGTAEQRKRWFSNGFASGQPSACETFGASRL